jgi:hypothetical protein
MFHAVLERRLANPMRVERFLRLLIAATQEARHAAPIELPDEGTRLIFGYHLAHLAKFSPARIPELADRFRRMESAFGDRGRLRATPLQVLLHAMMALERLERLGLSTSPEEYSATFLRVRNWIHKHKDLSRSFHTEYSRAEDLSFLAANVTARAFFAPRHGVEPGKPLADVGAAAAYEAGDRAAAPLLGQPFGTLMLQ